MRDLYLFGSVARGEARVDSDVDLLVEFDRAVGLLQFFRVQQRLSELLGRPVDLVMKEAIKPAAAGPAAPSCGTAVRSRPGLV